MEDMKVLEELREKVLKEIRPIVDKQSITPSELNAAKEAVCLLNEIKKALGSHMDDMETSEGPHYMRSYGHHEWMDPYEQSMMRGRDARTGRFMSRDGMDTSGRRYTFSYDSDGYSGCYSYGDHTNPGRSYERNRDMGRSGHSIDDRVVDMLERMMDSAASEYERRKLNSYIRVVDSMRGE